MKRLLSIELQKIWKNKASCVLTITYFILLCFIALFASIKFDIGPFKFHLAEMGIFNFPFIWHFNTYFAAWFKLFLAIIIVSMIANEYSYGTLKQNLIDGMTKKEFLFSKFFTILFFSTLSTTFLFIVSLILGYSFSSCTEASIVFSELNYFIVYFISLVSFFSFCLFFGILLKRSAFALGFLFLMYLVEAIIHLILYNVYDNSSKIISFFPLHSISNLIREPFTRLSAVKNFGSQIGIEYIKDYEVNFSGIVIVLVWTTIFMLFSYRILKKRDL